MCVDFAHSSKINPIQKSSLYRKMRRKRKNSDPEEQNGSDQANNSTNGSGEVYEKGGRVLRVRDTCMCPVCGFYFSPSEIQSHAQACLYIQPVLIVYL